MIILKLFTLLCLTYYSVGSEEDVLDLTDSDFSVLQDHETALVMFYAPWCGHCKRLKPEFGQAATSLKANDPPVALVKVDCTEGGKSTCEKYSVSGYPTLKIFRKGVLSQEYNGPREAAGIVKFMKAQVGPSSKDLTTVKDFEDFIAKDDVAVVGFFEKETDLKGEFLKAADKLREKIRFAHTSSSDVLSKAGFKDNIVLYRPKHLHNKFEDASVAFEGEADSVLITKFIKENTHGLVGHRQKDDASEFQEPLVIAYYGVDYKKNPKGTNYWRNRVLKVASDFKDLKFAISNKDEFANELNEYGVDFVKGEKPVIAARRGGLKYVMKDEFDIEKLRTFVKDLVSDKLEPFIKSESIPENNDGPVIVAVGKNFDDVVENNDKDVLVEFYAPWCGHCKKLTPIWEELGEKMAKEEVAIVKMDATANDVPKSIYEVRGFPTIYWKPKGKPPVKYEGGRDVDDFLKYIAREASSELKGYDRSGKAKKEEL